MIHGEDLPAVNACLNSLSAILVVGGYVAVRNRRIPLHKALMLAAVVVSAIFLASYLSSSAACQDGHACALFGTVSPTPRIAHARSICHNIFAMRSFIVPLS